jgi:hypothetical protein
MLGSQTEEKIEDFVLLIDSDKLVQKLDSVKDSTQVLLTSIT